MGTWLDGGRSDYEYAVDCKKEVEFNQTKWLESPAYVTKDKSAISPKGYDIKNYKFEKKWNIHIN